MTTSDTDVVVCGAGAGGLAAACALGALGLRVLVAERRREPARIAKGELLQPSSMSSLTRWGAAPRLSRGGGVWIDRLCARDPDGHALLELDYGRTLGADRRILSADYPAILTALADSLPANVELRRGIRVEELVRNPAGRVRGVVVTDGARMAKTVSAELVIAADGSASALRAAAGIALPRAQYPHRLVSFEIPGRHSAELTAYVTDRGLRLAYPLPHARTRLYLQAGADELRGLDDNGIRRWAANTVAEVEPLSGLGELLLERGTRRQIFGVPRYLVDRLSIPGMALLGESAHAVHPMAAQGMNSAIADAVELTAQLREAGEWSSAAVDSALRGYHRVRLPQLRHVATVSHNAARMLTAVSPMGRMLGRRLMRGTAGNPRLLAATCRNIAGIEPRPLRPLDRLYQLGLLRDPNSSAQQEESCK
ncbi:MULTISPECIES: NAD(P)/FAD-dependent oxidoreductase [unclassified Nocardia]|uniref:FAD-dependent oxidoreductase n=1 Tax=unclassified Nocardia TaxID=2637762 RepID=UPI001CE3C2BB|nr:MULTISPECIES: NAD(P)/FAD-dependent oxidoreductase [unclassified Nocardia]